MEWNLLTEEQQVDYLNRMGEAFVKVQEVVVEPPPSETKKLIDFMRIYRDEFDELQIFGVDYVRYLNNIIKLAKKCQDFEMLNNYRYEEDAPIVDPNLILCITKDIYSVPEMLQRDRDRGCLTTAHYNEIIKILNPINNTLK